MFQYPDTSTQADSNQLITGNVEAKAEGTIAEDALIAALRSRNNNYNADVAKRIAALNTSSEVKATLSVMSFRDRLCPPGKNCFRHVEIGRR